MMSRNGHIGWIASISVCCLLALASVNCADAAPAISVSPTSIAFSNQSVGTTSAVSTITVKNSGTGSPALSLTSVALSGSNTSAFIVANGCTTSVAAGKSCTISVKFSPPTLGAFKATLNISSNGSTSPATVLLSGSNPLRALPTVYTTAKAIAYSPYRAGGPGAGEVPAVSGILQDLGLMSTAGFGLIRLYGADPVTTTILQQAAASYPSLRFQLGIYLEPTTACSTDSVNASEISTAVSEAKTYATQVASVSVGNETQFTNAFPVSCLASYVNKVRSQVTQPVTVDDVASFYAGQLSSSPASILPLIDFVSLHTYPFFEYSSWNWQQTATVAGSARATAMMNAALNQAKADFSAAYNYLYPGTAGATVSIGASLPMVVGETGWKHAAYNTANPLEVVVNPAITNPVNEKLYWDLMTSWRGTTNGPVAVFAFEAFDEQWKGTDNGWGFWDQNRNALYPLCGTPTASACATPVYTGAGYYH